MLGPFSLEKNKQIGFRWSYSYYFFLGRYLAGRHEENKDMISEMVDKSYVTHNSLALIFIVHHSYRPETIDSILNRTRSSLDGTQPISLDLEEVEVFQDLLRYVARQYHVQQERG